MLVPLDLVAHICRHLLRAYTARLICKDLHLLLFETGAAVLRLGPSCSVAPAPEDVPLYAVLWSLHDTTTRRALSLKVRARLLEVAVSRSHTDRQLLQLKPLLQHLAAPFRARNESRVYDPACAAAAAGNRPGLRWLHARGWPLDRDGLLHAAAEHADLSLLQWLHTTFLQPPACNDVRSGAAGMSPLLPAAAGSPNQALGKVSWLLSLGCRATGDAACAAARCGHLPVLQLLAGHSSSRSSFLDDGTLFAALQGGALHVADWLVAQGLCSPHTGPGFRAAVRGVAAGGRVESMRWVQQQYHVRPAELPSDSAQVVQAALRTAARSENGSVQVIDWLVTLGADPIAGGGLIAAAAASGSVCMVRHVVALGCRDFGNALVNAAARADGAMLRFLLDEAGCPWEPLSGLGVVRALAGSGAANSLQLLQWLTGRGYEPAREDYAVTAACSAGKLDVVRWLVEEQGYPVGPDALPAASGSGCCALVELLLSHAHVPGDKG